MFPSLCAQKRSCDPRVIRKYRECQQLWILSKGWARSDICDLSPCLIYAYMVVFGTRPEAIKLAPLVKLLKSRDECSVDVCVTAQHREMLDQVLALFDIVPDVDLNLMRPGQDLTDVTCRVLESLRGVLRERKPDWVIVQGDTTTTFAAALAAFYEKIAVAHVEAGLRTGNVLSPWPEEINRRLTSVLTRLHFPPTEGSRQHLLQGECSCGENTCDRQYGD